jgi:hypothetical protein
MAVSMEAMMVATMVVKMVIWKVAMRAYDLAECLVV